MKTVCHSTTGRDLKYVPGNIADLRFTKKPYAASKNALAWVILPRIGKPSVSSVVLCCARITILNAAQAGSISCFLIFSGGRKVKC